jgi:hypothetical protein
MQDGLKVQSNPVFNQGGGTNALERQAPAGIYGGGAAGGAAGAGGGAGAMAAAGGAGAGAGAGRPAGGGMGGMPGMPAGLPPGAEQMMQDPAAMQNALNNPMA